MLPELRNSLRSPPVPSLSFPRGRYEDIAAFHGLRLLTVGRHCFSTAPHGTSPDEVITPRWGVRAVSDTTSETKLNEALQEPVDSPDRLFNI